MEFIVTEGSFDTGLSELVKKAYNKALTLQELPTLVTSIDGMSGKLYREFINNLVSFMEDPSYLEIGSWKGSTACSALYNNKLTLTCIDNWSEFGGPKYDFLANIKKTYNKDTKLTFIEEDFRKIDYSKLGKFNIYLFDGPHEAIDQYDGLIIAQPALEYTYILIVDDYNWEQVRLATELAIKDLEQTVISSITIKTTDNNEHASISGKDSDWHNGYFLAVLQK